MYEMNSTEKSILKEIKKRLTDLYHPRQIFLFGSYAWGTPHTNSDFDIAVIVEENNESAYLRPQKGTLALWDIDRSIDLLVFTREEFYSKAEHPASLQYKILKDGSLVYEAA